MPPQHMIQTADAEHSIAFHVRKEISQQAATGRKPGKAQGAGDGPSEQTDGGGGAQLVD